MPRFAVAFSLSSAGQYLVFVGSDSLEEGMDLWKSEKSQARKSGEISRNLRFSRFFVPASKSDTHDGWGGRIRTDECRSQSPVPYRLATPH